MRNSGPLAVPSHSPSIDLRLDESRMFLHYFLDERLYESPVNPVTVWKAQDYSRADLGERTVVLKIFAPHALGDATADEMIARFLQEQAILLSLSHPHIVKLFIAGRYDMQRNGEGDYLYLVTEYMEDGTLADRILDERLPRISLVDACQATMHVLDALQYVHTFRRQPVLHRDVKPENVFLRHDPTAALCKLGDFGVAHLPNSDITQIAGKQRGTPTYAAPELYHRQAPIGIGIDIYAATCMLWLAVTGELPCAPAVKHISLTRANVNAYAEAVRDWHLNTAPQFPYARRPETPPHLVQALCRGLAKRPEERFPSAQAFADALSQIVGELTHDVSAITTTVLSPPLLSLHDALTASDGFGAVNTSFAGFDIWVHQDGIEHDYQIYWVDKATKMGKRIWICPSATQVIAFFADGLDAHNDNPAIARLAERVDLTAFDANAWVAGERRTTHG